MKNIQSLACSPLALVTVLAAFSGCADDAGNGDPPVTTTPSTPTTPSPTTSTPATGSTTSPATSPAPTPTVTDMPTTGAGGHGGSGGSMPSMPTAAGGMGGGSGGVSGSGGTGGGAAGDGGSGGDPGGGTTVPATFDTLKTVLQSNLGCLGSCCHGGDIWVDFRVTDELYTTLTTATSEGCENLPIVNPGDPENSALVRILKADCGEVPRMPAGCIQNEFENSCVPDDYIAAIEQWIADGAPEE